MASLSFSAANGQYESDWFKPSAPFQLDLRIPNNDKKYNIIIYSALSSSDEQPWAVAFCGQFGQPHLNIPVMNVIQDCDVYFKVGCTINPTSGYYVTAS